MIFFIIIVSTCVLSMKYFSFKIQFINHSVLMRHAGTNTCLMFLTSAHFRVMILQVFFALFHSDWLLRVMNLQFFFALFHSVLQFCYTIALLTDLTCYTLSLNKADKSIMVNTTSITKKLNKSFFILKKISLFSILFRYHYNSLSKNSCSQ